MAKAKAAGDRYGKDYLAHRLAESRHIAKVNLAMQLRSAREEGLAEGRKKASERVRRMTIVLVCEFLELGLDDGTKAHLEAAGLEELERIYKVLLTTRALPKDF